MLAYKSFFGAVYLYDDAKVWYIQMLLLFVVVVQAGGAAVAATAVAVIAHVKILMFFGT